jgi:DNA-binding IclR family transcriptional regulator
VDRALDVLCAFATSEELGISELSRRLELPKSAVHRLMSSLAARDFVARTSSRRYRLGMRILELGNICRLRLNLVKTADPLLRQLSARVGANAHLARLDGVEVVDLMRIEHPAPLRIGHSPLLRRPAHCTALGKCLLAFGPQPQVDRVLEHGLAKLTRRTITDPARLAAELVRVRQRGYAIDNEEFYAGLRCLAAPVFGESGALVAAVSVSALVTSFTEDRVESVADTLVEAARQLSMQLGYRGVPVWERTGLRHAEASAGGGAANAKLAR